MQVAFASPTITATFAQLAPNAVAALCVLWLSRAICCSSSIPAQFLVTPDIGIALGLLRRRVSTKEPFLALCVVAAAVCIVGYKSGVSHVSTGEDA